MGNPSPIPTFHTKQVNMAWTQQKKKILKKRGRNGIRANKYTLYDKLPKMRITNEKRTLGPGSELDKDVSISRPFKKYSKLPKPIAAKVGRPGEVMRSARALKCKASELQYNATEGMRVYRIAEEKNASFCFYGTEISRLLTFVQTVDIDMQTLAKTINPGLSTIQENHTPGSLSFTLAINLHNVRDYFDMHDSRDYYKMPQLSPLRKVEDIRDIATLPVNTTSSIFSISIERQCIVIKIICFKLNALCEKFWNTLATMSGKLVEASLSRKAPALPLHNWHFHNITQGYLLMHLLNSSNVVTLNTMRKLYFVIITSPYPHLNLNISLRCSKNGIFTALDQIPVRDFCKESMSWSRLHEAVWMSSMKAASEVDGKTQANKVYIRSANSETRAVKSERLEEADLTKFYCTDVPSDSESSYPNFYDSNRLVSEKRSVATVCDLSYDCDDDETSLQTEFNWKDVIYSSISKITSLHEDFKMGSLNFLRNKVLRIAVPKTIVERNNLCCSRFYYGFINENLIFDAPTLKKQYLNQIEPIEFGRVFLKSFGKTLIATMFSTII